MIRAFWSGMMTASNREARFPARISRAVTSVNGMRYWSNTQRVHPSSIDAEAFLKIAMRRAWESLSPGATQRVVGTGATTVVAAVTESGTIATSNPYRSGRVWAVTSYGRFGGPPGYSCRFGYR